MVRDALIRRLRFIKLRLSSRGKAARLLVPIVEVCEFSLSHGIREVIVRSRMRLSGRTSLPPRPEYAQASSAPVVEPASLQIPPSSRVRTSIVIPVLNNADLTHRCLQSIVEHTPAGEYEVILVDNGSDDETRQMLSHVAGLRVIRNDENRGFVEACNQGGRAATGEFVLFLNNDTIVLPNWLNALLGTFDQHERTGAVGAKLVYPSGRLQEAGGIIWSDGDGWNYGHNEEPESVEYCYVREVDYCSGACLVLRRLTFEQLGGFDLRYAPAYYEDTDLAFRLREINLRVMYQPAARVVHFGGATAGTDTSSGFKSYQVVNHQKFKERHAAALAQQYPHDPSLLRSARDRRRGPRVLLMDHMVPHHDQDSGSVRMTALLRILCDLNCRVTFLPDNMAQMEPYTSELQQIGIEVLHGPTPELEYVASHRADFDIAILCRGNFAVRYLPALRGDDGRRPFVIFDTIDLHYLREQRQAELTGDPGLARSAARTREVELDVMRASDMVWVTSTHEAEILKDGPGIPAIEIVPNIHSVRTEVPPFGPRRDILFVGGFRHLPNEDAVRYFVDDILPHIVAELPGVQFLIAGSHMPPGVQKLASEHVKVLGYVQDLVPVYDACRLTVAPLRYGAGVKGKVTQSLAWGVPSVATPVAAEGMHLKDGEHLMVAGDPVEFARRVVEVYRNEAVWNRLSAAGRAHIQTHLGYEAVRGSIGRMLERAMNRA